MSKARATTLGATARALAERLGLRVLAGLAVAALLLWGFAELTEEVLEGDTQAFDEAVRTLLHAHASSTLTTAMKAATTLGSVEVLAGCTVIALAALWAAGRRRSPLLLAVTMAGAAGLNWVLKVSFRRERPDPFFDVVAPSSYSFPSGHALFSLCFYGALAALLAARMDRLGARIAMLTAAAVLVVSIGVSRIYLGVHYPSDVIAGYLAALVWVVTVAAVDRALRRLAPPARAGAYQEGT